MCMSHKGTCKWTVMCSKVQEENYSFQALMAALQKVCHTKLRQTGFQDASFMVTGDVRFADSADFAGNVWGLQSFCCSDTVTDFKRAAALLKPRVNVHHHKIEPHPTKNYTPLLSWETTFW